jgi:hypothetical protein
MTLILSGTDGLSDIDGSAATPAIRGTDANTGIFFGADIIGFAEGGAEVARFNADAQFVAAAGTALLPVITTTGDVNTGIFFPAADTIAFVEGGVEAMRINASGNVEMVGTLTTASRGIAKASMPAGSVLQVLQAAKTDTQSTSSATFGDITGLSVSITPTSISSKILVTASVSRGTDTNQITNFQFMRDSTAIGIGDTAGSRVRATMSMYFGSSDAVSHIGTATMTYLDSPATTSATTYKVQFRSQAGGQISYINRNSSDGDGSTVPRTISTITVMEIAA